MYPGFGISSLRSQRKALSKRKLREYLLSLQKWVYLSDVLLMSGCILNSARHKDPSIQSLLTEVREIHCLIRILFPCILTDDAKIQLFIIQNLGRVLEYFSKMCMI